MPLRVDIRNTEAFKKNADTIGSYSIGVMMMVTGIPEITDATFPTFIQRVFLARCDTTDSFDSLAVKFRPYIGATANVAQRTRADFLRSFKEVF